MSIKKLGRGGEYLYFSVKKKFYSLVFLVFKIVCAFAGSFTKKIKKLIDFVLNYTHPPCFW